MRYTSIVSVAALSLMTFQSPAGTRPKVEVAAAPESVRHDVQSTTGISSVHDVGIIPGAGGCPAGSELITIHMDDEDDDNNNHHSGWIGGIEQDRNTTLKFCRVDGDLFKDVAAGPFAVLQLSPECPAGGKSYGRWFENERHNNANYQLSSFGYGIAPNESYDNYTLLDVCQFNTAPQNYLGSPLPSWFPDIGVEYGVFASSTDLRGAPDYGTLYTDDEDGNVFGGNHNLFDPPSYYESYWMSNIISGGVNTEMHFAKVRPYCFGKAVMKINGHAGDHADITGPDWPIIVDGSASTCTDSYFISIQLSDSNWNRYGPEAMRWLTPSDFAQYGDIKHFNVKKFAEDQWFGFAPGQYYRVKLAVGPAWNDTSTLIFIKPYDGIFTGVLAPLDVMVHVEKYGDMFGHERDWVGTKGQSLRLEGFSVSNALPVADLGIEYMASLAGSGDTAFIGGGQYVGTRGESRQMEGFAARLIGANASRFDLFYQCHMAYTGDSQIVTSPDFCGTRGESRRIEALRFWIVAK